jgi:hypothetical protein
MICRALLPTGFLMFMFANPAVAEVYKLGSQGALYCETEEKLQAFMIKSLSQSASEADKKGCGVLPPATVGSVGSLFKNGDITTGDISVEGINSGKSVSFLATQPLEVVSASSSNAKKVDKTDFSGTFKVISPDDVRATPNKWVSRDIEFKNINVYWVDDNDVRFLTSTMLTLFSRNVSGSAVDIAYLKNNCETSKEATSSKCRVSVKFNYTQHSEDSPNGLSKRTILISDALMVVRKGKK